MYSREENGFFPRGRVEKIDRVNNTGTPALTCPSQVLGRASLHVHHYSFVQSYMHYNNAPLVPDATDVRGALMQKVVSQNFKAG